jgi:hypothetical protein
MTFPEVFPQSMWIERHFLTWKGTCSHAQRRQDLQVTISGAMMQALIKIIGTLTWTRNGWSKRIQLWNMLQKVRMRTW